MLQRMRSVAVVGWHSQTVYLRQQGEDRWIRELNLYPSAAPPIRPSPYA